MEARVPLGWAIVLAGGDGTRLRPLTADANGAVTPKQFCSLRGGRSLLGEAIGRAARVVGREHVVVVVSADHERWWRAELEAIPVENRIVQPRNMGTAAGVLLPLLSILGREPRSNVLLVPSDHHVEREDVLADMLRDGLARAERFPDEILLYGITPEDPETEYGWIVPRPGPERPARVDAFVEKPAASISEQLFEQGALWNSFLLSARGSALLALYRELLPDLLAAFLGTALESPAALAGLYQAIDARDFARDLLQGGEARLRVLPVGACGWTDLGTPARVAACLRGADGWSETSELDASARPILARALRSVLPTERTGSRARWKY